MLRSQIQVTMQKKRKERFNNDLAFSSIKPYINAIQGVYPLGFGSSEGTGHLDRNSTKRIDFLE